MEKKIMKIKSCVISGQRNLKENICRFFTERKYISGITVIELVLILVRNFTPYLGCVSFIFGIIEITVIQTEKNLSRICADGAIFSVFGEYESQLMEAYHIFGLDGSYGTGDQL